MVQNHEKRHEAFPLKGGVLLFRCHEDLSFLCDWIECLSDDFIVCPGCQVINDEISHAEYDNGSQAAQREQRDIGKVQCRHEFGDHFERSQQMDHRTEKREEKDSTDLASNGASDLLLAHAHLLHDGKTRFVLVPFRNLLIVNNQHCGHQEQSAQERTEEEETTLHGIKFTFLRRPAAYHVVPFRLKGHLTDGFVQRFHGLLFRAIKVQRELPIDIAG